MSTYIGRNATFKVGSDTVSEMTDWSITVAAEVIREDTFGSTWAKKHGLVATDWSATVNGLLDDSDTTGQDVLWDAVVSGTKVTNLRFYLDGTEYYTSNTGEDAAAGAYITSNDPSIAQGDVGRLSITIEGTGPIYKTS